MNGQAGENPRMKEEWLFASINSTTRYASHVFFVYIAFLAYTFVSLLTLSDRAIALNESANLPVLNLSVEAEILFFLGPFIALLLFVFLQVYLVRLRSLVEMVRKEASDMATRRIDPWFLNIAAYPDSGLAGVIQRFVASALIWWSLPSLLLLVSVESLKLHNPQTCIYIGAFSILVYLFVGYYWIRTRGGHLGQPNRTAIVSLGLLITCWLVFYFALMVPKAHDGTVYGLDLRTQNLVNEQDEKYKSLKWADYRGVKWQGSDISYSVLKKADLQGASLRGCSATNTDFTGADMSKADLSHSVAMAAVFEQTFAYGIDVSHSNLAFVVVRLAIFEEADFRNASLQYATLRGSSFKNADFTGANLTGADFRGAVLHGAKGLDRETLCTAKSLYKAQLDSNTAVMVLESCPELLLDPDSAAVDSR